MADAGASSGLKLGGWRLRLPQRLPNLKGRWLTLYTIIWAAILPAALAGAAHGTYVSPSPNRT